MTAPTDSSTLLTRIAAGLPADLARVLATPTSELSLSPRARRGLRELGVGTVADLCRTSAASILALRGVGRRTLHEIERALRAAFGAVTALPSTAPPHSEPFDDWLQRALDSLDPSAARLAAARLGFGRAPASVAALAAETGLPPAEVTAGIAATAATLLEAGGAALRAMLDAAERDLDAHGGVLSSAQSTAADALGRAVREARRPDLPLRLAALCKPLRFTHDAGRLVAAPLPALRERVATIRDVVTRIGLPCALAELQARLAERGVDVTEEFLDHALRAHLGATILFRRRSAPRVVWRRSRTADHLESILDDAGGPLRLDDLLFHYRDRHASARRHRLHDVLRADSRFLEVRHLEFDLRIRHLDTLEMVRPLADALRAHIVATGQRTAVQSPVGSGAPSERTAHLVTDLLRHDRSLRYLGRGQFCARRRSGSSIVAQLVDELRAAMGEVPFARFLQNQEPRRRRLVARLLRDNRRFVFPTRDRVDLLENYPFNPERLRLLLRETSSCLHEAGGHAPLTAVHAAVEAAGLGGSFLDEHLLLDLLRRHGNFEILPGPVVADPDLALGAWIQRTARDALRQSPAPLSAQQLLAACPTLAEFGACLESMLDLDPLVQTADGLHYELA
ncbi:MAG: hypothetical protein IPM29_15470 [Planctomycetes bacterium]|nr:hypothetical protein [Planctomycetota bacterium]